MDMHAIFKTLVNSNKVLLINLEERVLSSFTKEEQYGVYLLKKYLYGLKQVQQGMEYALMLPLLNATQSSVKDVLKELHIDQQLGPLPLPPTPPPQFVDLAPPFSTLPPPPPTPRAPVSKVENVEGVESKKERKRKARRDLAPLVIKEKKGMKPNTVDGQDPPPVECIPPTPFDVESFFDSLTENIQIM